MSCTSSSHLTVSLGEKTMCAWKVYEQRRLTVYAHCRIINAAFNNDKSFQNVLNTSFEHFINLSARAPEYISLFMDDQLRKVMQHLLVSMLFLHDLIPLMTCFYHLARLLITRNINF